MRTLRRGVLALHALLGVAATAAIVTAAMPWTLAAVWLVLALAPLGAAAPGLLAGRRYTCQWLTLVLVAYVGAAIVEVLASAARASFASLVLLIALAELALLLALIRQAPGAPRGSAAR